MFLLYLIFSLLLIYLGYCVSYLLLLSVSGKIYQRKFSRATLPVAHSYRKIAILIPAYKEDAVIVSSVLSYEKMRYPKDYFDVYVIADQLQSETLEKLRMTKSKVIPVSFEKSSKAKAINAAFQQISDDYDIALICDADNVLHPDFLSHINICFSNGYLAVQGQRVAKNLNTPYAILDAASEMINNHLFRMGNRALGFSSAVIGSGMAFDFQLLKEIFLQIDTLGGFDKQLQLLLTQSGIKIFYEPRAIVFDEKVTHSSQFTIQRKRWLFSHVHFLQNDIGNGFLQLLKGNIDYFNLSVLQALIPPRFLLGVCILAFTILSGAASLLFSVLTPVWIVFLILGLFYLFSLLLAMPSGFLFGYFVPNLSHVPYIFLSMFLALFSAREAKRNFLHTVHFQHQVNNPLYEYE
ncbi:glycosyltransferase [Thermoflavifilum thermophilum]|uniref:Glycosyltransferase, catalytic subunit of cellulose synthase and poly-beta-1,6-N-acetylglucosamine synthase n=1 Tax=Thermoflavifilum thermophilum TaxID=1393122 RepID=A0A1I7NE91_9BACT|nr:glycosyltransferase [Thermoflavifilum thermophilum]SFV32988.1 Glycosyltransferase, catalytic subunit of cellulose synthase and poly-beta-1,6-N-acetylglucosamine synthase [Thermoflavifilum thermophilum]